MHLAASVAEDPDLLAIAMLARHGPVPNLFLAAVHDLLLKGHGPQLAAYYPTISGERALPPADAPPVFREFVMASIEELKPALQMRLVQTNEVRRAAMIYLALAWLRSTYGVRSSSLIEVGTSAGLLLAADRYSYRFGPVEAEVFHPSALNIEVEIRGVFEPPIGDLPEIVDRFGIDLKVLDANDEADRRWARAMIWGDQPERVERLERAIAEVRRMPARFVEGDANATLRPTLDSLPTGLPAIVFHSHALNQFTPADRERFDRLLCRASKDRDIYRISMEGFTAPPECVITTYRGGEAVSTTTVARYEPHGAWIEWLA